MESRKTGYLVIIALVLLVAAAVVDIFLNGKLAIDLLILSLYALFRWIVPIVMCLQMLLWALKNIQFFFGLGSTLLGSLRWECFTSGVYIIAASAISYYFETAFPFTAFLLSAGADPLLSLVLTGIGVLAGFIVLVSAVYAN
jgi:hypothetical protein